MTRLQVAAPFGQQLAQEPELLVKLRPLAPRDLAGQLRGLPSLHVPPRQQGDLAAS